MSHNTHDHIKNRIYKRSDQEPKDGFLVELEEGSGVTHLELPIRFRDPKTEELIGHIQVKAIVRGSAPLLELLSQKQKDLLLKEPLIRSGAELVYKKKSGKLDYTSSILKTLSFRYPNKKSVDWFSFYISGLPKTIAEEPDFDMHRHFGVITIEPSDFKKLKDGEVGIALNNGSWTHDYDGFTEVVDNSGDRIGSAQVILAIDTRNDYFQELMPVIDTLELARRLELDFLSKSWVKDRVAEFSNNKKGDAGWMSIIYYLPETVSFSTFIRLLTER